MLVPQEAAGPDGLQTQACSLSGASLEGRFQAPLLSKLKLLAPGIQRPLW